MLPLGPRRPVRGPRSRGAGGERTAGGGGIRHAIEAVNHPRQERSEPTRPESWSRTTRADPRGAPACPARGCGAASRCRGRQPTRRRVEVTVRDADRRPDDPGPILIAADGCAQHRARGARHPIRGPGTPTQGPSVQGALWEWSASTPRYTCCPSTPQQCRSDTATAGCTRASGSDARAVGDPDRRIHARSGSHGVPDSSANEGCQPAEYGAPADRIRESSAFYHGDAAHRLTPRGATGMNTDPRPTTRLEALLVARAGRTRADSTRRSGGRRRAQRGRVGGPNGAIPAPQTRSGRTSEGSPHTWLPAVGADVRRSTYCPTG